MAAILQMHDDDTMRETLDRLERATEAFHGFMSLINGGECLKGSELYRLLEPVEAEFDAALNCLRTSTGRL